MDDVLPDVVVTDLVHVLQAKTLLIFWEYLNIELAIYHFENLISIINSWNVSLDISLKQRSPQIIRIDVVICSHLASQYIERS